MFSYHVTQWLGQTLDELANAVMATGLPAREVGVLLYSPGLPSPPISGEVLVAIVALKKAGFLL